MSEIAGTTAAALLSACGRPGPGPLEGSYLVTSARGTSQSCGETSPESGTVDLTMYPGGAPTITVGASSTDDADIVIPVFIDGNSCIVTGNRTDDTITLVPGIPCSVGAAEYEQLTVTGGTIRLVDRLVIAHVEFTSTSSGCQIDYVLDTSAQRQ